MRSGPKDPAAFSERMAREFGIPIEPMRSPETAAGARSVGRDIDFLG